MVFVKSWDETAPANTDQVGDGDDALRDLKYALRERLAVEHNVFADETGQSNVAIHNEGSARCTEDTYANIPANAAALAGREFFATDRGQLFVGAGSSWNSGPSIQHRYQQVYNSTGTVAVTNGSTAVTGTLTNFTDLGSGTTWLFRVAGERWYPVATVGGATSITLGIAYAGTTQTGVNYQFCNPADHPCYLPAYNASVQTMTLTGGTLGGALAAGGFKITGLAAPTVDTDAAHKKYVDDTVAAAIPDDDAFGTWTSCSLGTVYQAASDGFVCAMLLNSNEEVAGWTDSSNPPTTERLQVCGYSSASASDKSASFTMPVKKSDYWKVTSGGTPTIYWLPIGA